MTARFCGPLLILLLAAWGARPAVGQVPAADTSAVEQDIEAALEDLDVEAGDPNQLVEDLEDLAQQPLDINRAGVDELAQVPAFGPAVASNIVGFRTRFGPFGSIPELRAVEGVTAEVLVRARPYLTIGEGREVEAAQPSPYPARPSLSDLTSTLRIDVIQRVTRRLDVGRGYDDAEADAGSSSYLGSPERLYTRLRARSGRRLSLNLTLEKDPGEAFGWDPGANTFGYDHLSAHAALGDWGRVQRLVVGDYVLNYGQGVVLWQSTAFGKGREPVRPIARYGQGVVPFGSTEENQFFRGAAGAVRLTPHLTVAAFASRHALDATVLAPDTAAFTDEPLLTEATSLSVTGLHRTPNELDKKDALVETLTGGALEYTFDRAKLGAVGYFASFDGTFEPPDDPFRRYAFRGRETSATSVYGHGFFGDFNVFGEVARSHDGALGGVAGAGARLSRAAEAVVVGRHFPKDFVSLHGYAFGERAGATQNETGLYLGLRLRPSRAWSIAGYFDQYRFPWLRFGVDRPTTGYDALVVLEGRPRRWLHVYAQGRTETREGGAPGEDPLGRSLGAVREQTRQSLRLHGDYVFSPRLRLRARAEGVRFAEPVAPDQYGVLLFQDLRLAPRPWIQLDLRLALVDTDSYDARVFAYENDLLYTFAVPAFSGRGQRFYALLRLAPWDRLVIQVKYGVTRFEDQKTVGSGLDEVEGQRVRELRAQVRVRL